MNETQQIIFIVISIITIVGLIYVLRNKINDFHIFQKAVILQDINLENKFNEMDSDYNKIVDQNNMIANKITSINNDCQGVFSACSPGENNTCNREYVVVKEKTEDGQDCPFTNGHIESCPSTDVNCGVNCVGDWEESVSAGNTIKTFRVTQSKTGNGIACDYKHGETEFVVEN